MAAAAATRDPRFPPIDVADLRALKVEISVLTPDVVIHRPEEIEIGRHGLDVRRGGARGLLLPQVAVEHGLDRETFLAATCRKAGLPADAWHDADDRGPRVRGRRVRRRRDRRTPAARLIAARQNVSRRPRVRARVSAAGDATSMICAAAALVRCLHDVGP